MTAPRHHLAACDSTNDEAARLGRDGAPHGTVVTASVQHRGRGRQGHSWHSPAGENLYLSVLLRPAIPPHQAPFLTLCAGVALADTVAESFADSVAAQLKWPNDLLLAPRAPAGIRPLKAAGILTEMACTVNQLDFVVVGIGVNLNTTQFPPELSAIATSLRLCMSSGQQVDGEAFLQRLLVHLDEVHDLYVARGAGEVLPRYQRHAAFLRSGQVLEVHSGAQVLRGVAAGLSPEGALLLRDHAGTVHRVISGEVTTCPTPHQSLAY